MGTYVTQKWPAGEALDEAIKGTASDWAYVAQGNVVSEHQTKM